MSKSIVPNGKAQRQASPAQRNGQRLAVIYTRVSTTDQADKGYSLPTQLEACQTMAQQEGYTVSDTHVFVDDYTGTSLNRPQFTQLRDLVRQRLVQAVFVHDLDRLSRKLAHQLLLSDEFEQAGVALRIVTMPEGATTPETQLLSNVRGIIAEYERAKILERTARGRRGRAQAGHVTYGGRTLGYVYVKHADKGAHYEVHPEEAALVRRIFRLCVEDGLSSYAIAELLTREGVPTSLGQRRTLPALVWHPSTIASMALQHGLTDVLADLGFEGVNGVGKFGIGFYRAGRYMIFLGQTFPRFSENFFIFKRFLWSSIASLLQVIPLPPEIALLFGRQVAPSELQRNHPVNYRPGSLQRGIPL